MASTIQVTLKTSIKILKLKIVNPQNGNTSFDNELKSEMQHLINYPQMLPFIGNKWKQQSKKILFLGESHYIPGDELKDLENETHLTDWYNNTSDNFYEGLADYIDTRGVVEKADNPDEEGFAKPLTIFYNIKRELKNNLPLLKNESQIFPFFSFYNYFQRPHFVEGDSIQNNENDNQIAFQTLKSIIKIIKPTLIIFVSTKAKQSFRSKLNNEVDKSSFDNIVVDGVPHASSQWWNRKSAAYSNKTGREKFISLITAN
jgi:hypothetical protein